MSGLVQAFEKIRGFHWMRIPYLAAAERYVMTGDATALAQVTPFGPTGSIWGGVLADGIRRPPGWGDADRRALHVLAAAHIFDTIGEWFDGVVASEKPDEDLHALLRQELTTANVTVGTVTSLTARRVPTLVRSGRLTSAGRYLLSLDDTQLREAVVATAEEVSSARLLEFLLTMAPDRVPAQMAALLGAKKSHFRPQLCGLLLKRGGARFEKDVRAAFDGESSEHTRFGIACQLFEYGPEAYRSSALAAARASLAGSPASNNHHQVGPWMVEHYGHEVLGDMVEFLSSDANELAKRPVLSATVQALGKDALPAVVASLAHGTAYTKLAALPHLMALDDGSHRNLIKSEITAGLAESDAETVVKYLAVAARSDVGGLAEAIWPLVEHKAKPVRDSAARTLGRMGEGVVPRASELLKARRAAQRLSAVVALATAGTTSSLAALEAHLEVEDDEDVRDAILLALQAGWRAAGRVVTLEDIERRVGRLEPKLARPVAPWIDESRLPELRTSAGRVLSHEETRYLLYRQSRARTIAVDVELAPFLEMLDRSTSGAFALEVLKAFLGSGADAKDRWALALACLLGDDRVVPILSRQVREWADAARGKLAEYAVQALALRGSDEALLAVDALAIRYRTKNKNIGKAAVEAFASAAEAQGLTPDELGDRVVPWLGFQPKKPRVLAAGQKKVEVTIGLDFKLRFRDAESKKRVASLPETVPSEVLAEMKDLSASLREITKAQLLRIENLMVRQRRWPTARWREMFLAHPLLVPFAVQLVWGVYDEEGKRGQTFRALEDLSLTDATDTAVELPAAGAVGIVHPLELAEAERQAWQIHLADSELSPPFLQLERPVVHVAPGEAGLRSHTSLRGTVLNGLTFKGRAERLGWQRGSVCDGGGITSYWKAFPASGTDAFLGLEGMYMGMDMDSTVKVQDLLFVRGGSVEVGSYTYDDPPGEDDARVIPFGQVPPIVFSEVMGDLKKIAAQGAAGAD